MYQSYSFINSIFALGYLRWETLHTHTLLNLNNQPEPSKADRILIEFNQTYIFKIETFSDSKIMSNKAKVIIDTDCGVDDAQAILIALSEEFSDRIDVVGITCCSGNVLVDQVAINVLKVLAAAERLDIPVYKGACSPILCK